MHLKASPESAVCCCYFFSSLHQSCFLLRILVNWIVFVIFTNVLGSVLEGEKRKNIFAFYKHTHTHIVASWKLCTHFFSVCTFRLSAVLLFYLVNLFSHWFKRKKGNLSNLFTLCQPIYTFENFNLPWYPIFSTKKHIVATQFRVGNVSIAGKS